MGEPEERARFHEARLDELERIVSDHAQRFDTLQTPLWKRVWFRIDGWPGQRDLNGVRRWRPWHRLLGVFALVLTSSVLQTPVEQQTPGGSTQPDSSLWVTNPTSCVWDADDAQRWTSNGGDLKPGTIRAEGCIVADHIAHLVSVSIVAPSPALDVTLALGGFTAEPQAVQQDRHLYRYTACLLGPDYSSDLPEIEGSNGGHGVIWSASVEIANPTTKTVRNIGATFRVGWYVGPASSCPDPFPISQTGERLSVEPGIWRSV